MRYRLVSLLLLTACRDPAAEALARAQYQHQRLLAASARPEDPQFDAVLAELKKVPETSRHFAPAQALTQQIVRGRTRVRTPLALGANGQRDASLVAQLAACARLAQMAGADGGVDARALAALEQCRFQAEKMEIEVAHGEEPHDGGAHP